MRIRTVIVSLYFILIIATKVFAQFPLLRHYTTNDGIPSDKISPMIQDKDGFIWFGTDVGVTRFNGIKFQNFTLSDGLSDNNIVKVKSDSKGRVWFLGSNGTVSYWYNGKIFNSHSDTILKYITATTSFIDFFEDHQNRLWFLSGNEMLVLSKNKIKRFKRTSILVINSKFGPVFGYFEDNTYYRYVYGKFIEFKLRYTLKSFSTYLTLPDRTVLFTAREGVVWQNDTIQKLLIPFHGEFDEATLRGLSLSADSLLWITAQGRGLYSYDLKNPTKAHEVYLKQKLTSHVLVDSEGNIWVSTLNDGLYMIPAWGDKVMIYNKENGLASSQCYSINKLKTGELLVGMDEGKVNLISKGKTSDLPTYECCNLDNQVSRILSRNDDIWIATKFGLVHKNAKTGCDHLINDRDHLHVTWTYPWIMHLVDITLGDNNLYIAGYSKKFEYPIHCKINSDYSATPIKEKEYVKNYCLFCDISGQVWYGTQGGLKSKKGEIFLYHAREDTLLSRRINSIAETNDSTLVLATQGFGVLFYKKGKIVNRITLADGLCENICRKIFIHRDRIYVSTPSGVSVLFYSKGIVQSIQNLNTGNFLPSNFVYDVYADDKDISVATQNGVAVISQSVFDKIKSVKPLLSITEIRVNDRLIALNEEYKFSYKENSLKVKFIGINYQKPYEVNYRYKLKDDQNWETTNDNNLDISFLQPGKYHFQMQARVLKGEWSPVKSFDFTIMPPFWKTWWFVVICILLGLALVARLTLYQLNRINKMNRMKLISITAELHALRSQLNPHFIFNALNSIQEFVLTNDTKNASKYLSDFAGLMRTILEFSRSELISIEEEVDFLQRYLSLEQLRFLNKFNYKFEIDPAIDPGDNEIHSLLLQPFVENAIIHGVAKNGGKGMIFIRFLKSLANLIVEIEDNGPGLSDDEHREDKKTRASMALMIFKERIEKLNEGKKNIIRYSFNSLTAPGHGTKISLDFENYFV